MARFNVKFEPADYFTIKVEPSQSNGDGIRVNHNKCQLIGLDADEGTVAGMASILNCPVGGLPFKYLGVSMGVSHRKFSDWSYVISKVERRILKWEKLKLSYAGRLTLLNSVLNALPTYVLSIYKAPLKVIKKLTQLQRNFLWTGNSSGRKVSWISWRKICTPLRFGGLGVQDLALYNKGLLGKWVWKWLNNQGGIWGRIIDAKWGLSSCSGDFDHFYFKSCKSSGWWRDIIKSICDDRGVWFKHALSRVIGDGRSTSFWYACWAGDVCFRDKFPRLFALCTVKDATISNMGMWVGDNWRWSGVWRRPLRSREEAIYQELFNNLKPPAKAESDKWSWGQANSGEYSTKEAYNMLLQRRSDSDMEICSLSPFVWNKIATPKVKLFSWRLINMRIPTLVELGKRNCLPANNSVSCPLCKASPESIPHIFFQCPISSQLWYEVLNWIGCTGPWQTVPGTNLLGFRLLLDGEIWKSIASPLWQCGLENLVHKERHCVQSWHLGLEETAGRCPGPCLVLVHS